MLERDIAWMEFRQEVHDEQDERVDPEHEKMVWRHPRTHGYHNDDEGRVVANAPWRLLGYREMTKSPDLDDFLLREQIASTGARSRGEGPK